VLTSVPTRRCHTYPRIAAGILAFVQGSPGARAHAEVLTDLVAYLREHQLKEGTTPEGLEVLAALETRLRKELAAGDDAPADTAPGTA
jgi:hypothetical protein